MTHTCVPGKVMIRRPSGGPIRTFIQGKVLQMGSEDGPKGPPTIPLKFNDFNGIVPGHSGHPRDDPEAGRSPTCHIQKCTSTPRHGAEGITGGPPTTPLKFQDFSGIVPACSGPSRRSGGQLAAQFAHSSGHKRAPKWLGTWPERAANYTTNKSRILMV